MAKLIEPHHEIHWTVEIDNAQNDALGKIVLEIPKLFSDPYILGLSILNGSKDVMHLARKRQQVFTPPWPHGGQWPDSRFSLFRSSELDYFELLHHIKESWIDVAWLFVRVNDRYEMVAREMTNKRFSLFLSSSVSQRSMKDFGCRLGYTWHLKPEQGFRM